MTNYCQLILGAALVSVSLLVTAPSLSSKTNAAEQMETRCGWFSNPTPANIWLYDRQGEWTIGVQGGYQVAGDWDWPVFKRGQWVATNGSYGYGCVCLKAKVNGKTHEVLEIRNARARPLASCNQDPALQKWKHILK